MTQRHPVFALHTSRQLGSGSVRFITWRAMWGLGIAALAAAMAAGFAAGFAAGTVTGMYQGQGTHDTTGEPAVYRAAREHLIGELGKLHAAAAQSESRIARLAIHIDELRHFHARVQMSRSTPRIPVLPLFSPAALSGQGGPAQPTEPCIATKMQAASFDARATRRQMGCLESRLSALETEVVSHTMAWFAFPGRSPVDGAQLSSPFGNRIDPVDRSSGFHSGLDLVAQIGAPILAAAGGRVSFSGQKPSYGNVVEIDHGNGLKTRYGHASQLVARTGDLVLPRQHIADVGSTGRSTGPHLHFEVLEDRSPIDPAAYLQLFAAGSDD